jgi:hypothetical protein
VSQHLSNAAKDLESSLKRGFKGYLTVGWMKDDKPLLMVYYDQRQELPPRLVPTLWQGYAVQAQAVMPPGVRPKEMTNFPWII